MGNVFCFTMLCVPCFAHRRQSVPAHVKPLWCTHAAFIKWGAGCTIQQQKTLCKTWLLHKGGGQESGTRIVCIVWGCGAVGRQSLC